MENQEDKDIEIVEEELKIYKVGDEILRVETEEVQDINGELVDFIKKMFYTMYQNRGIGLAATQVGSTKRFFIADLKLNEEPSKKLILINPIITESEGSEIGEEGCLSVPGVSESVKRKYKVLLKAIDINGKEIEIEADGLLARVFQHELDHLHGKLFIDYLSPIKKKLVLNRLKKQRKEEGW
jgi:peptide deformylase